MDLTYTRGRRAEPTPWVGVDRGSTTVGSGPPGPSLTEDGFDGFVRTPGARAPAGEPARPSGLLRPHALRAALDRGAPLTLAAEARGSPAVDALRGEPTRGRVEALERLPLAAALGALVPGQGPGFTTLDVRDAFPERDARALFTAAHAACGPRPTARTFPLVRGGQPIADATLPAALRDEFGAVIDWLAAALGARFPDEPVRPALAEVRLVDADAGHTNHYKWHHDGHWFTATLALVGPSTTIDDDGHVFTPDTGSLVIFSGLQRAAAVPGVRATWHNAPPGEDRGPVDVDRLALMVFFRADPSHRGDAARD